MILRNCSKCKIRSKFVCSGDFRVNANGRNIDVWLIYKCCECDTTWNMEIFSRVKPTQIDSSLYKKLLKNDSETALMYSFDQQILNNNKAVVCYDDISYKLEKINIPNSNDNEDVLEIISNYNLNLRLDKILSDELEISRNKVKSMFANSNIQCNDQNVTSKTKVKGTIKIKIL